MRAVIAAVCVLLAVVCLTVGNAVWIRNTVGDIRCMAEALPEQPSPEAAEAASRLTDELERHEAVMSLSVSYTLTDRVRELTASLRAHALSGDAAGYRSDKAMLLAAIDDLDRLERLDIRNLM
ncbi:MAG: DUF4363 family protein [Clostridia bacterium]|nr:DUF4363 family protein [Clostridia bacterium]